MEAYQWILGALALALALALGALWLIKYRRHTGAGRAWCADAGTPGSEES